MKFYAKHPEDPQTTADYGWDRSEIQWFVTLRSKGRVIGTYDGITPGYANLAGALAFLSKHGFVEENWYFEAAHLQLCSRDIEDVDPELQPAAEILINFKLAAA